MAARFWLSEVKRQTSGGSGQSASRQLSVLFSLKLSDPHISSVQNDLLDNNVNMDSAIDETDLFDGDWPGFSELCKSYLEFCRNVNPNNSVESFDLYAQFLTDLAAAYSNSRGAVLNHTVVSAGRTLMSLSMGQDAQADEKLRTSYLSTLLLKLFNSIRGEKTTASDSGPFKKDIILCVATMLCRVYFNLGTPASCANVFSNIHTANIKFSSYTRAERVEYRYYLGRFHLMKNHLALAYKHLIWAFDNCPTTSTNKRLILTYLIPASLLLGKAPSMVLMEMFNLSAVYSDIVYALHLGCYSQYMAALEDKKQWLLNRGIYILLKSRAMVLVHRRNLLQVWKIGSRNSAISFETLRQAFAFSMRTHPDNWAQSDTDYVQLESVLASLISQGFVKANLYSRRKQINLRPKDPFPPLHTVYHLDQDPSLDGYERWMNV